MTIRYQSVRPNDAELRERMRAIARERRRFGYRRLHVMLKREGHVVNHKKLFRLYREEKLVNGHRTIHIYGLPKFPCRTGSVWVGDQPG